MVSNRKLKGWHQAWMDVYYWAPRDGHSKELINSIISLPRIFACVNPNMLSRAKDQVSNRPA
jgi:hypothetical protein